MVEQKLLTYNPNVFDWTISREIKRPEIIAWAHRNPVQKPTSCFDSFKAFWATKSVPQKMLAGGGLAGILLSLFADSESGFLKRTLNLALNVAGIATLWCPALILPVASIYVARGLYTMLHGGFGNMFAGALDIVCAVPVFNLYKSWANIMKFAKTAEGFDFGRFLYKATQTTFGTQAVRQLNITRKAFNSPEARKRIIDGAIDSTAHGYVRVTKRFSEAVAKARAANPGKQIILATS